MSNENIFNNKIRFRIKMRRKYSNSGNHPRLFFQLFNTITLWCSLRMRKTFYKSLSYYTQCDRGITDEIIM